MQESPCFARCLTYLLRCPRILNPKCNFFVLHIFPLNPSCSLGIAFAQSTAFGKTLDKGAILLDTNRPHVCSTCLFMLALPFSVRILNARFFAIERHFLGNKRPWVVRESLLILSKPLAIQGPGGCAYFPITIALARTSAQFAWFTTFESFALMQNSADRFSNPLLLLSLLSCEWLLSSLLSTCITSEGRRMGSERWLLARTAVREKERKRRRRRRYREREKERERVWGRNGGQINAYVLRDSFSFLFASSLRILIVV